LTRERYDHGGMRRARKEAISKASKETSWGLVLGTLGRQGSKRVLDTLVEAAKSRGKRVSVVLISELSPAKLAALTGGGGSERGGSSPTSPPPPPPPPRAWAQVACPRLSIDWGEGFGGMPVLTSYEAMIALGCEKGWWASSRENEERGGTKRSGGGGDCCGGGGGCGESGERASSSPSPSIDLEGDPERGHYPMDYYSSSGGAWAGTYHRANSTRSRRSHSSSSAAAARATSSSSAAAVPAAPVAPAVS